MYNQSHFEVTRMRESLTIHFKTKMNACKAAFCCVTMSTKELASEFESWTLKQSLLKTKSQVFSLQSQLYKAQALYEERKRSLKLQLKSLHENLDALKLENDNLRSSLNHCQADLETFRKQVTQSLKILMCSMFHLRREKVTERERKGVIRL